MNIYEKLLQIQTELKAPKNQFNKFGGYPYRSCEGILEAVKPLLDKYKLTIFFSDEIINIEDRFYIKTTLNLINIEEPKEMIVTTALAREELIKKGMDGSQITGTSSSYARKYALNGLFLIDDTKDSDTTNERKKEYSEDDKVQLINLIKNKINDEQLKKFLEKTKSKDLESANIEEIVKLHDYLFKK